MDPSEFSEFIKVVPTRMKRMVGAFTVVTREGTMVCDDGWLAIDAGGWPYPITNEEHARVYKPIEAGVTAP
jgi:hypothetical protein